MKRERIDLRVADYQKAAWEAHAKTQGLTLSEWLRRLADTDMRLVASDGGTIKTRGN